MTWKQVGRHNKPIVIVNLLDYWQPMLDFIDHMDRHKFPHHRSDTFAVAETPVDVMELLGLELTPTWFKPIRLTLLCPILT